MVAYEAARTGGEAAASAVLAFNAPFMTFLYHRWYNDDFTIANTPSGSFRDVCMTWSYTDPRIKETTLIFLLSPSVALTEGAEGFVEHGLHALKIVHIRGATSQPSKGEVEEVVCCAVVEIVGSIPDGVAHGTGGVIFLSTRHFLFHIPTGEQSRTGGKEREDALDHFVFTEKNTWERRCGVVRPLYDVEPIRHVLYGAEGNKSPVLHIVTVVSQPLPSSVSVQSAVVDLLVVASSRDERDISQYSRTEQGLLGKTISRWRGSSKASGDSSVAVTHTFVVAVVRCEISTSADRPAAWKLLHLHVDRNVPFQRRLEELTGREDLCGVGCDRKGSNATAAHMDPSKCVWCYLPNEGGARAGYCGLVFALVPHKPSTKLTLVCGSYDPSGQSYRVGFVKGYDAHGVGAPLYEERDNTEEMLWSLAEDTHTVQMVMIGRPNEALHDNEGTCGGANFQGREGLRAQWRKSASSSTWMRKSGLATVLSFVVDFVDDGLHKSRNLRQGLHVAVCTVWERNRHGRFPLPRTVCWLGTIPLPIGQAATSAVLFHAEGNDEGMNVWRMMDRVNLSDCAAVCDDTVSWYHALPTSVVPTVAAPVSRTNLRCFVSVNTLLKKTQLTYVLDTRFVEEKTCEEQRPSLLSSLELSKLFYTRPAIAEEGHGAMYNRGATSDDCADLAAYVARSVASSSGPLMVAHIFNEAWRSVALVKHPETAVHAHDGVARDGLLPSTDGEMIALGDTVCHFLLLVLQELDWINSPQNTRLHILVLSILEAVYAEPQLPPSSRCFEEATNGGGKTQMLLVGVNEQRTVRLLLQGSGMWRRVAPLLFAWANYRFYGNGCENELEEDSDSLFEDILRPFIEGWEKQENMAGFDSQACTASCNNDSESGESCLILKRCDVILRHLQHSQDCDKYRSAVAALFRGGVSLNRVTALASWAGDVQAVDPAVLLFQLLLEVCTQCEEHVQLAAAVDRETVCQLAALVVQSRLPPVDTVKNDENSLPAAPDVLHSMSEVLSSWNFEFLRDWPLGGTCGALPVVYLFYHMVGALMASPCDNMEDRRERCNIITHSVMLLQWLCGDDARQSTEVFGALISGKVPLVALCTVGGFAVQAGCAPSSGVLPCDAVARRSFNRVLYHLFVSPTTSVLPQLLLAEFGISYDYVSQEKIGSSVWKRVLEGDVAAAFSSRLLNQLHKSLGSFSNKKHPTRAVQVSLLLEYLRSVFMVSLPRLVMALGESEEIVEIALGSTIPSFIMSELSVDPVPPVEGCDNVTCVFFNVTREVKKLLHLYMEGSGEVRCLAMLFGVFCDSCKSLLGHVDDTGNVRDSAQPGGVEREQSMFTFTLREMYFISLQVLSSDMGRFVVVAELIRRSVRRQAVRDLEKSLHRFDASWLNNSSRLQEFISSAVANLDGVVSSLESVAPLYAHTLVMIFLDELVLLAGETTEAVGRVVASPSIPHEQGEGYYKGEVIVDLNDKLTKCVKQMAAEKWKGLRKEDRRLIARVLSSCLVPYSDEAFGDGGYEESDVHLQMRDVKVRMSKSLQRRTIDPTVMGIVVGEASANESDKFPVELRRNNDSDGVLKVGGDAERAEFALLVKEEAYVRRKLKGQLLDSYAELINGNGVHDSLAILYLALREEQRRRRFVEYVTECKDFVLDFAISLHMLMREYYNEGVYHLQEKALREMERRVGLLLLQEREARTAIEAVHSVGRDIYFCWEKEQRSLFDGESRCRLAMLEDEENTRDGIYEHFAKEEVAVVRRCEERLEEEAWRHEEEQWALEMKQREDEEEVSAARTQNKKPSEGKRTGTSAFTRWQERRLQMVMVHEEVSEPMEQERCPTPSITETETLPTAKPEILRRERTTAFMQDPVEALTSLVRTELTEESVDGRGYSALFDSSESLFGAISRFQQQIISTVAPPPLSVAKQKEQEQGGEMPHRSPTELTANPHSSTQTQQPVGSEWEWGWDEVPDDAGGSWKVSQNDCKTGVATEKYLTTRIPDEKKEEFSEKIIKLEALSKAVKPRPQRRRPFGGVVNLNAKPTEGKVSPINDSIPETGQEEQEIGEISPRSADEGHAKEVSTLLTSTEMWNAKGEELHPFSATVGEPLDVATSSLWVGEHQMNLAVSDVCEEVVCHTEYLPKDSLEMSSVILSLSSFHVMQEEEGGARLALLNEERIGRVFLNRRLVMGL